MQQQHQQSSKSLLRTAQTLCGVRHAMSHPCSFMTDKRARKGKRSLILDQSNNIVKQTSKQAKQASGFQFSKHGRDVRRSIYRAQTSTTSPGPCINAQRTADNPPTTNPPAPHPHSTQRRGKYVMTTRYQVCMKWSKFLPRSAIVYSHDINKEGSPF